MKKKKYLYLGNHPNSIVYDSNLPTGWNYWSYLESLPDEEEDNDGIDELDDGEYEELEDENTYD